MIRATVPERPFELDVAFHVSSLSVRPGLEPDP